MKLEMLGHANLLVRTQAGSLLFDPLFYGVHHEGVYDVYPERELSLASLPHFDAVVLSHAHADHFDLPSVNLLPRSVPILIPDDGEMRACVEGLGFRDIITLHDFETLTIGELKLTPTPASVGAREHGFVLEHEGVRVWNMIDSFPSEAAVAAVLERHGPIDLLLSPWQPLHDSAVSLGAIPMFPHAMYSRILTTIAQVRPRLLVPGACGFRAVGPAAWTNRLLFPLTRERFVHDLALLDPELAANVQVLEPGDGLTITRDGVAFDSALLGYVRAKHEYDWRERAFRPLDLLGPALVEHREAASLAECGDALRSLFEQELPAFVEAHPSLFRWHRQWRPIRQYEVVFAGGERLTWSAGFSADGLTVTPGDSPLRTCFSSMTAGLLIGLIGGALSWDFAEMSGELRRIDFTYDVDARGLRLPHTIGLEDPLAVMLSGAVEREQYRAGLVEALAGAYQQAIDAGVVTEAPIAEMVSTSNSLIDPTAIATQVMKSLGVIQVDSPSASD